MRQLRIGRNFFRRALHLPPRPAAVGENAHPNLRAPCIFSTPVLFRLLPPTYWRRTRPRACQRVASC